jgi:3-deoxy-manno-octulosonate cytidylyltransferase (CMP-KDO synthetase)
MSKTKVLIIIPARFNSSRFPGKPLVQIANKSMLERTFLQATQISNKYEFQVYIATDHEKIIEEANRIGAKSINTDSSIQSGTERCFAAASKINFDYDYMVNIQGDEPFILPSQIEELVEAMHESQSPIATLCIKLEKQEDIRNSNIVKVVKNKKNEAMYFSRSIIPFPRNPMDGFSYYKHIGVYGFNKNIIPNLQQLDSSPIEQIESLEQLKWLDYGLKIKMVETSHQSPAVDSPEDLLNVENFLVQNPSFL